MSGTDKRKQSVYFSTTTLKEIAEEATRLDRSLSWIVQKAWKLAKKEITRLPKFIGDRPEGRDVRQDGDDDDG
jgi:uncharacterized small protein (TIGR04563 family)